MLDVLHDLLLVHDNVLLVLRHDEVLVNDLQRVQLLGHVVPRLKYKTHT